MNCLAQLELDIKKEQVDLLAQLGQSRNNIRGIHQLYPKDLAKNPARRKICCPKGNYRLRSINLIINGEDLEDKLPEILTNYYFEIEFEETKFSNTGTLTSSRLFERYLSRYLSDEHDSIFVGESKASINIFNFKYSQINPVGMYLNLYIQDKPDPSLNLSIEYIYEPNATPALDTIPFVRPKNGSEYCLFSDRSKKYQLIRNSGYCYGMVLCFISTNLSDPTYPSLEKIKIYPSCNSLKKGYIEFGSDDYKTFIEFGPDDFKTIETPIFKYVVLMFDPNYRSDENICEMLDGYLFDSKKIRGINFSDTTDPATNNSDSEDDESNFSTCAYKLEFSQLDPHDDITVHENLYYLDCVEADITKN